MTEPMTEEQGRYALECASRRADKTRLPRVWRQDLASMILVHVVRKWSEYDPSRSSWRTWVSRSAGYGYQAAVRRLSRELPGGRRRPGGAQGGPKGPFPKGTS